jgi:hypothetical protein
MFWNLVYMTTGIYIAQQYPEIVPNVKDTFNDFQKTLEKKYNIKHSDIFKIFFKK